MMGSQSGRVLVGPAAVRSNPTAPLLGLLMALQPTSGLEVRARAPSSGSLRGQLSSFKWEYRGRGSSSHHSSQLLNELGMLAKALPLTLKHLSLGKKDHGWQFRINGYPVEFLERWNRFFFFIDGFSRSASIFSVSIPYCLPVMIVSSFRFAFEF